MYDLPSLVEHVCQETGYDKVSGPCMPLKLPLSCLLPYLFHFSSIRFLPTTLADSVSSTHHHPYSPPHSSRQLLPYIRSLQVAFIGHSQGNGLAFISLSQSMVPSLGKKLSVFIALAPAVYAGPLTTGFPFTALNRIEWSTWKRFFGVLDFIPLMRWAYNYCPAKIFVSTPYRTENA
jgi:hypothetical protein